jgi:hypothetical protein
MAKLSVAQIYNAARKAGFAPDKAVIATAIALAESIGGDPNAHNPGTAEVPEDSWGLWQINIKAHPQFADWNLTDPLTNARAAYAVSNGGRNFAPWSTYGTAEQYGAGHTNSYAARLPGVYAALGIKHGAQPPDQAAGGDVPSSGGGGAVTAQPASVLDKLNPFSNLGADLSRISIMAAFVIGGVALAVLGLYKGVEPTVQRVKSDVTTGVAAAGKAAAV